MTKRILAVAISAVAALTAANGAGVTGYEPARQLGEPEPEVPVLSLENQLTGVVRPENVPLTLNIPEDYAFIPGEDVRRYMKEAGSPEEDMTGVLGMILPHRAVAQGENPSGFILKYDRDGHVYDDDNLDFKTIIGSLRDNVELQTYFFDWEWTPYYDAERHILSMPVKMSDVHGQSATLFRGYVLGGEGAVRIMNVGPPPAGGWQESAKAVGEMISFNPGDAYSDYRPKAGDGYYPSLMSFLNENKEVMTEESPLIARQQYRDEYGVPYPVPSVGWIIALGSLAFLALLFYLLSLLTDVSHPEPGKSLKRLAVNSMMRIGVFFSVYFFSITFGVFLVVYGVDLTKYFIAVMPDMNPLIYIAGWVFIAIFAIILIKPLFSISTSVKEPGVPISPEEAPELFQLIEETAREAGLRGPRKVFLSYVPNAMVFSRSSIWNIFFPVRRNLMIGLGLLYFTNRSELKAVLAHEFGHFGQKTVRVGSAVYIGYSIVNNIISGRGPVDALLARLGPLPASVALWIIGPVLTRLAGFVQRGYGKMQKEMEYGADAVSADIVGNRAAVSAMYKSDVIASRVAVYNDILGHLASSSGKAPQSYWGGYEAFLEMSSEWDGFAISAERLEEAPLSSFPESRVKIENIWETHPSSRERVASIRSVKRPEKEVDRRKALEMVDPAVFEKVSARLFQESGFTSVDRVDDEEYRRLVGIELSLYTFPREMRPFFGGDIVPFNVSEVSPSDPGDDIFSEENSAVIKEIRQAVADYHLLCNFAAGNIKVKRIRYCNGIYSRKNVPVEAQKRYVESLEEDARKVEKAICAAAMARSGAPDLISKAYDDIFYSQFIIGRIQEHLFPGRDMAYAAVAAPPPNMDEQAFEALRRKLLSYRDMVWKALSELEMERLAPVVSHDVLAYYEEIRNDGLIFMLSTISGEEVEKMLEIPDRLIRHFMDLAYYSKKKITDILEGKAPIMSWGGSMAEEEELRQAGEKDMEDKEE